MTAELSALNTPISFVQSSQSLIPQTPTNIHVVPVSNFKRKYTVHDASSAISAPPIFAIAPGSGIFKGFWNFTHIITSSSGLPVLECRRQRSTSSYWSFRVPDEKGVETELGSAGYEMWHVRLHIDAKIRNACEGGRELKLELRGIDKSGTRFEVKVEGKLCCLIGKRNKWERKPTWEVQVAPGFDLHLGAMFAVMVRERQSRDP